MSNAFTADRLDNPWLADIAIREIDEGRYVVELIADSLPELKQARKDANWLLKRNQLKRTHRWSKPTMMLDTRYKIITIVRPKGIYRPIPSEA